MSGRPLMVIEHDPTVQMILIDMFAEAGYDVRAVISAEDVRTLLSYCQPEVAVISGGSRGTFAVGWRMAQLIAEIDPAVPLIMLTTNYLVLHEVGQTERGRLFAAGLLKPFDLHELLITVARHRRSANPAHETLPRPLDVEQPDGPQERKENLV